ncbi:MAG TPA: hypothetical protein VKU00_21980 [Chthonomonadaceae bacterium]|nr:hypothetical protein [Chthonomonadaceae bacterium]
MARTRHGLLLLGVFAALSVGACSPKEDPLDTSAPPPSKPVEPSNSQPVPIRNRPTPPGIDTPKTR